MDRNEPQRVWSRLTAMAAAALAVASGIVFAPSAQAQITFRKQQATFTNSGNVYRRCGESDFDQKRQIE